MENCKKPPLGIMPRWLWIEKRLNDLAMAINRFVDAGKPVPLEWIEEYNELLMNKR